MTTKQIAEAVGKDITTVQRWVKKLSGKMQSVNGKMQSSTSTHPADYTEQETIAIIRAGMGEETAGVYKANAEQAKPTPAISPAYLQQLRLAVQAGLLDVTEARAALGLVRVATGGKLPNDIARQVYAVAEKSIKKHLLQIEDKKNNPELF